MTRNLVALTRATPFLNRFVGGYSRRPILHSSRHSSTAANPVQIRGVRSSSLSGNGVSFKDLGRSEIGFAQLHFGRVSPKAVSDDGSNRTDGFGGGSGDGNYRGRGEGGGQGDDSNGDNNWSFLSW